MNEPQSPEGPLPDRIVGKFRYKYPSGISDKNMGDLAGPCN